MATTTTMGVKLDEETRERLKNAAQKIDRTPHWLIRQAVFNLLESIESGNSPLFSEQLSGGHESDSTPLKDEPLPLSWISLSRFCHSLSSVRLSLLHGGARKPMRSR